MFDTLITRYNDKIHHFWAGYFVSHLFIRLFPRRTPFAGILIAAIAGAAKEYIYDMRIKKRKPELADFLFTVAGGIAAALVNSIGSGE